jgi:hypothetical protein
MVPLWPRWAKPSVGHRRGRTVNRPNPTSHRIRGGIRPPRTYTSARVCAKEIPRVCAKESCGTRLSQYNRYEHCFTHAPTRFPRVRGVVVG